LIERLLGVSVIAGRLALLAGSLATALLLTGFLIPRLVPLAGLLLVRHGCFLSWERQDNDEKSGFVPTK
jgi:hypothetical protein